MVEFAPSSQLPCDVLVKLTILEVFVAVYGLMLESLHLHKRFHHASIGVCLGRHHVCVHVLQLRKVVLEEYIVQKGAVLGGMVKR